MPAKTIRLQTRLGPAFTLGVATLAAFISVCPVFAVGSNQSFSPADQASGSKDGVVFDSQKLGTAEKLYFGSAFEQLPVEQRMDKIERAVFGHNRSGSLSKRFDRVTAALGADKFSKSQGLADSPKTQDKPPDKIVSEDDGASAKTAVDGAPGSGDNPEIRPEVKPETKSAAKPAEKTTEVAETTESKKASLQDSTVIDARVQSLLKSGMSAHRSGQIQMAEGHFKAALVIDPRCADAFYNLGSIAESKGDLLSALTNYRAALGINPLDRELQNAVKAVEDDMAKRRATSGGVTPTAKNAMPKIAPAFNRVGNNQSSLYAGHTPSNGSGSSTSADNKLFNLQTAQSNALMQAQGSYPLGNVSQPPIPVYNVSQQTAPTANVGQQKTPSHNNTASNALVNVLMQASGLHCPICRLRSMGNW